MTSDYIGMEADAVERKFASLGREVRRVEQRTPRGVEGADSARVIRVRELGNNMVEITTSDFKTRV